ncbi:hypothetical protein B0T25DRAFT_579643 [Lasiosphaeria hispida]|uniref:Uncharacterized protein n=1 Tax=Lasiosphaeria hispida TaxID=260671 RepID=A0AAJ0HMS1_9PEZI|nr:hypothetical protein B0T25DRAFT_579643 [Lasiosphaeria hispida]
MADDKLRTGSSTDLKSSPVIDIIPSSSKSDVTSIAHAVRDYNEPIPEYEVRHLYDPTAEWTEKEKKRLVRKVSPTYPEKMSKLIPHSSSYRIASWVCLMDFDMWPLYVTSITMFIPTIPVGAYLTLNLRSLGFDMFEANLLTILAYVLFLIQLYALTALMIGFPYIHSINFSLTSQNAGSVRTRTIGSAMYNMVCQASYVASSNILLAAAGWNMVMTIFVEGYCMWRNKTRATTWDAMTLEERDYYLRMTKDEGNKRIDFRFAH